MNTKYDDEIRQVETRLVSEREQLIAKAEDLGATARDAAVSPKGLMAAFAVGFIVAELLGPRRRAHSQAAQTASTTAKIGVGGLLGSALFALARTQYGSPWSLGRGAWDYALARRARRAAAMQRTAPIASAAAEASTPSGRVLSTSTVSVTGSVSSSGSSGGSRSVVSDNSAHRHSPPGRESHAAG